MIKTLIDKTEKKYNTGKKNYKLFYRRSVKVFQFTLKQKVMEKQEKNAGKVSTSFDHGKSDQAGKIVQKSDPISNDVAKVNISRKNANGPDQVQSSDFRYFYSGRKLL